jgi:hypothetical protein
MEISVVDIENIPPGCLLSLGPSGKSKRQAPLVPRQKFAWRSACASETMQVNVFSVLATAEIVSEEFCSPIDASSHTCNVLMHPTEPDDKGELAQSSTMPMRIGLKIKNGPQSAESTRRSTPSGGSARDSLKQSPCTTPIRNLTPKKSKDKDKQQDERAPSGEKSRSQYLDEHGVMDVVEGIVSDLMRERPADPWAYFASRLPCVPHLSAAVHTLEQAVQSDEALPTTKNASSRPATATKRYRGKAPPMFDSKASWPPELGVEPGRGITAIDCTNMAP